MWREREKEGVARERVEREGVEGEMGKERGG